MPYVEAICTLRMILKYLLTKKVPHIVFYRGLFDCEIFWMASGQRTNASWQQFKIAKHQILMFFLRMDKKALHSMIIPSVLEVVKRMETAPFVYLEVTFEYRRRFGCAHQVFERLLLKLHS